MSTEVARYEPAPIAIAHERSIEELVAQANKIKQAMEQAMEVDHHYGKIPGTPKPTLFKPGAEKLCLLFRLDPQYDSTPIAPDVGGGGHITYKSVCTLYHIPTGQRFGSGEASCSTRESKYAYRTGKRACPKCGSEAIHKSKFPPKGKPQEAPGWYCYAKVGGCGQEFSATDPAITGQQIGRIANVDLADAYNTVLKMANKRALVAAVLNVTAASDLFTQDLDERDEGPEEPAPARKAAPAPRPVKALVVDKETGEVQDDASPAAREEPDIAPGEGFADDPPFSEVLERSLLLTRCGGAADKAKLSAAKRADILVRFNIRDPREASLDQLTAMLEHLRGLTA